MVVFFPLHKLRRNKAEMPLLSKGLDQGTSRNPFRHNIFLQLCEINSFCPVWLPGQLMKLRKVAAQDLGIALYSSWLRGKHLLAAVSGYFHSPSMSFITFHFLVTNAGGANLGKERSYCRKLSGQDTHITQQLYFPVL